MSDDGIIAAQRLVDELARERARLAELRPAIEAQAKTDARAALMQMYRPAVKKLVAAVEAAREANTAVLDLWAAGHNSGLELPSLAWLPLLPPDAPAIAANRTGRELAGWLTNAAELIE